MILLLSVIMMCFFSPVSMCGIASANEPSLLWETSDLRATASSPVVDSDGTIYVSVARDTELGSSGLYAFNPDGTVQWKFETRGDVNYTPALDMDDNVYVVVRDSLFALTHDGVLQWFYETDSDITGSPAIGYDGSIYVGSSRGFLYAVSPDGDMVWKHATGEAMEILVDETYRNIDISPAVGPDGTIYIACYDSNIYAVSPTGVRKWVFQMNYPNWEGDIVPAFGTDGTIYCASKGNRFYAINSDGTMKWEKKIYGVGYGTPVVSADGFIYFGTSNGSFSAFYKMSPDGVIEWEYPIGASISSSPAIGHDGTVYFGCGNRLFYALNPDGTEKWSYEFALGMESCPALTQDGTMYLNAGSLIALATYAYGYQPGSPWPGFSYSPQRSIAEENLELPEHYMVSGQIATPDSLPLAHVMVSADGLLRETDYDGFYSFMLPNGDYTITVHLKNPVIPQKVDIAVRDQDVVVHLYEETGSNLFQVSGRLVGPEGSLVDATVNTTMMTTQTDGDGYFAFNLANGPHRIEIDAGENRFPGSMDIVVEGSEIDLADIFINSIDWSYAVESSLVENHPAIGIDGTVYFTTQNQLHAISQNGEKVADIDIGNGIISGTTTDTDGTVYLASWDAVHALTSDLTEIWKFVVPEHGAGSAPAISEDGTILFGAIDKLYAITKNGALDWDYFFGDGVRISDTPVLGSDGTVYVTVSDTEYILSNSLYALTADGALKWEFATDGNLSVAPVIGNDGTLYFGSYDNYFYALNPDGTLKWKYWVDGAISEDAVIDEDGTIYVATQNYHVYAFNPDGTLKWNYRNDYYIGHSLWVCPQTGELWIYDNAETIALGEDGSVSWHEPTRYMLPVGASDGRVFAVSEPLFSRVSTLYAINIGGSTENPTGITSDYASLSNHPSNEIFGASAVYPNPFNPSTTIEFSLLRSLDVRLDVYTITGQKVSTLVDEVLAAGAQMVRFDGAGLASGVYFARISADGMVETQKMLLVK